MARKTAPQPLALGSTDAPGEDPPAGETHPQSSTPISSSSPTSSRSPRSPFGFAHKQQQSPGERKPLHVADLLQHPQHPQYPLDASQYLHISSALHQPQSPPLERTSGQLPREQQQAQRPYVQEQKAQQPRVQEQQFQPPSFPNQQSSHRHHRNNEEKTSKSGFFFNFAKSSKSADRLNTDQYSDSRSDIMSRDADQSLISRHNTRQAGKSLRS